MSFGTSISPIPTATNFHPAFLYSFQGGLYILRVRQHFNEFVLDRLDGMGRDKIPLQRQTQVDRDKQSNGSHLMCEKTAAALLHASSPTHCLADAHNWPA